MKFGSADVCLSDSGFLGEAIGINLIDFSCLVILAGVVVVGFVFELIYLVLI